MDAASRAFSFVADSIQFAQHTNTHTHTRIRTQIRTQIHFSKTGYVRNGPNFAVNYK